MPAKAKNAVTWQQPEGQKASGTGQKTLRNGSDPEMMSVKRKTALHWHRIKMPLSSAHGRGGVP